MLVFAASDKGGTGRSVTCGNVAYRRALRGEYVSFLDFDFGSPTAGMVFQINSVATGTDRGGLHSFLRGSVSDPCRVEIWSHTSQKSLRSQAAQLGQFTLFPGDDGGGEFPLDRDIVRRCIQLFLRVEAEYDVCFVDLSAGRSYATEIALAATAAAELGSITVRWLVFHRWTRQHVLAAAKLAFGRKGIVETGAAYGHDRRVLTNAVRFVRTAVVDPASSIYGGLRDTQAMWFRQGNSALQKLASIKGMGRTVTMGSTPLEPVLQLHEQLITDDDVAATRIANQETVDAFADLAKRLDDPTVWEPEL